MDEEAKITDPRCPRPENAKLWGTPLLWWEKDSYPDAESWNFDDWLWQFVRRNREYREIFDQLAPRFASVEHGVAPNSGGNLGKVEGIEPLSHGPGSFTKVQQAKLLAAGLKYWPFIHSACRRWSMSAFYDPRISHWFGEGPTWHSGDRGTGLRQLDPKNLSPWGFHLKGFLFDKERPIGPQIKEAKAALEYEQSRMERTITPRRHEAGLPKKSSENMKKWPTYLQAIDARSVGATNATIAYNMLRNVDEETAGQRGAQLVNQAEGVCRRLTEV
ncbi:hypothetical protein [uncultured Roseobacter sp.]|uniref:hypothetical protein n=1 Tax=uncultured Roseobacter sp. TaxID=114847 RepID=UPI002612EF57|nr:hypothetical protein [uncultured Roseobacter sp.]